MKKCDCQAPGRPRGARAGHRPLRRQVFLAAADRYSACGEVNLSRFSGVLRDTRMGQADEKDEENERTELLDGGENVG